MNILDCQMEVSLFQLAGAKDVRIDGLNLADE